jgi:hypothetical protein
MLPSNGDDIEPVRRECRDDRTRDVFVGEECESRHWSG